MVSTRALLHGSYSKNNIGRFNKKEIDSIFTQETHSLISEFFER